jgi:hypothetical protein
MCCFSDVIRDVSDTNIFARNDAEGRQFLVYQMNYDAERELAMILPVPVPIDSPENAVKFINLEKYPEFFEHLARAIDTGDTKADAGEDEDPKLKVVQVGDYVASFVPAVKDFSRLDEQFRLPSHIWTKTVPQYADYGFVVFQLKPGRRRVHPMAFKFPRRNPNRLFFPTMHIHDGKVHESAAFDHILFCQFTNDTRPTRFTWEESKGPAKGFVDIKRSHGIVDANEHVYYRFIHGRKQNIDVLV